MTRFIVEDVDVTVCVWFICGYGCTAVWWTGHSYAVPQQTANMSSIATVSVGTFSV